MSATLSELFQNITNAVRGKTLKTGKIEHLKIPDEINGITTVEMMLQKTIIEINTNVTEIPSYAFYSQINLETVNMPNVTSIGEKAFYGCYKLKNINLGNVKSFGTSAMGYCTSLKEFTLWSWINIPYGCFYNCTSLHTVTLKQVQRIELTAFQYCTKLNKLIIETTNKVCVLAGTGALNNTPISEGVGYIYVPDYLVDSYKTATNWSVYANQIKGISELESEVTE